VIRAGLRRLLVLVLVVVGGVAAIFALFAALAGRSVPHALAVGYYLAGCALLVTSFALGVRGPTRAEPGDEPEEYRPDDYRPGALGFFGVPRGGRVGRRARRKATPEERKEARLSSAVLFVFGVFLLLLGAAFDPARRVF
jgi:hypothetical protein